MAEATAAVAESKLENPEDLFNALFDKPGPLFAQVCMVGGGTTAGDLFYRLRNDEWREAGAYGAGKEPRLRDAVRDHGSWRLRCSPFLSSAPTTSCIVEYGVVPVVMQMHVIPPERVRTVASDAASRGQILLENLKQTRGEHRFDPDARAMAQAKLRALAIVPSVIVDSGSELVALYVLADPVRNDPSLAGHHESSPFVYTMHRLATRLAQSANYAHRPSAILVDLPGIRRDDVKMGGFTGFDVSAVQVHDQPVAFKDLEAFSRS